MNQKQQKNQRHRLNVLKEWRDTENNYIRDLNIIITKIQIPFREKHIITPAQEQVLFPNIDVIIKLSQNLVEELNNMIEHWRPAEIQISPALARIYPFFKIYIEYCNKYYKGQNILKEIRHLPEVVAIEKQLLMDIDSYLIKPIQRPPKYMLLLRDYQKHMDKKHPDYNGLTSVIENYHSVNQINNDSIARQGMIMKTFYLETLTGRVFESTSRTLRKEFDAATNEYPVAKVYVFSTLLIVTYIDGISHKETVSRVIELDEYSYATKVRDGKYFSNILFVCGKYQGVHILLYDKKELDRMCDFITMVLKELKVNETEKKLRMINARQRPEAKVEVTLTEEKSAREQAFEPNFQITVEGVEKRALSVIKNETYYVIKYAASPPWKLNQNVYTRYSTIEEVYNYVTRKHPELVFASLNPPILDVGLYDQKKNKSKIIEFRIMAIQELLNQIFRCSRLMENPIYILDRLKIDDNLWEFAVRFSKKQCECKLCREMVKEMYTIERYMSERESLVREKNLPADRFCVKKFANDQLNLLSINKKKFNTLEKIMLCLDAQSGRIDYSRVPKSNNPGSLHPIKIYHLNVLREQFLQIQISQKSKVDEVITQLGKQYGIVNFRDFGLFLDYSGAPRLLDGDEILYEVLMQVEAEVDVHEEEEIGFFDRLSNGLNRVKKWGEEIVSGKKSRLVLKKYFFLTPELEQSALKQSQQRYRLTVQQAFYSIASEVIFLDDHDLSNMAACFIYLKEKDKLAGLKKSNFPHDTIKKLLPPSRHNLCSNDIWISDVINAVGQLNGSPVARIYEKIVKMVQYRINWDYCLFPVTNYDPATFTENLTELNIGVNYKNLIVVPRKSDQLLLLIPLGALVYKVTPFSIFIDLNDIYYRFDGRLLYNLGKIIEKYLLFNKLFDEILNGTEEAFRTTLIKQNTGIVQKSPIPHRESYIPPPIKQNHLFEVESLLKAAENQKTQTLAPSKNYEFSPPPHIHNNPEFSDQRISMTTAAMSQIDSRSSTRPLAAMSYREQIPEPVRQYVYPAQQAPGVQGQLAGQQQQSTGFQRPRPKIFDNKFNPS